MTFHALSDPLPNRTPLPAGQLSILLLLRFTEASADFVIYPFLSEVGTCCTSNMHHEPNDSIIQLLASVTGGDDAKVGYYSGLMVSFEST